MGDLYKLKFAFGNKWPKHVLTCKYHVVNEADARSILRQRTLRGNGLIEG